MRLKRGYTTGTCAALAVRAALKMIFEQKIIKKESIVTPDGIFVQTEIFFAEFEKDYAKCAVKKYSGDDPDVTDGIMIFAEVTLSGRRVIIIEGGKGIGRVTKKGLYQNIGEAAINKVPRNMIAKNAEQIFEIYNYGGGADIIISAPEGEKIAKRTFNPRLGIVGGISILGTSGIVEPMSEAALIETIKTEINMKKADKGDYIMIAPGNYGLDFIKRNYGVDLNCAVKCGNFVGEAIDLANAAGFKGILLIGHIGKFVKLAGGIMNTHSKNADGRMEIIASNTAMVCGDIYVVRKIMECTTTDDAVRILKDTGICGEVMKKITDKAVFYINNRLKSNIETGIVMFSNIYGVLGESDNATEMFKHFTEG